MDPTQREVMIMRELRYCAGAPGSRMGGAIGQAQDLAVERGWLELIEHPPAGPGLPPYRFYRITAKGQQILSLAKACAA